MALLCKFRQYRKFPRGGVGSTAVKLRNTWRKGVSCPPYEIGGKPNVREAGGCLSGLPTPLTRYASLPPCFHRGDQTTAVGPGRGEDRGGAGRGPGALLSDSIRFKRSLRGASPIPLPGQLALLAGHRQPDSEGRAGSRRVVRPDHPAVPADNGVADAQP
jgi:hypothetical protein